MKNKFRKSVLAVAVAALAVPAAAWAAEAADFAAAETETEQQNLDWYADNATDAMKNESCREDLIEPAYVAEYDGRVLVKAEVVAVGLITCVDIELKSQAAIDGVLMLQARHGYNDWRTVRTEPFRGGMTAGFGYDEGLIDYVFEPNDPHRNKPLRVCTQTFNPDPSPIYCRTVKGAALSAATALTN